MSGLDKNQLVFIEVTTQGRAGEESYNTGTGYLITNNLILTASHIITDTLPDTVKVRIPAPVPKWKTVKKVPVWADPLLDVALLELETPLEEVSPPEWFEGPFTEKMDWSSAGYPIGAMTEKENEAVYKTSGLSGKLYGYGGGGQGPEELDLGVDHEAEGEHWSGISGAPVFVGDKLAGVITESLISFKNKRLSGAPASAFLRNPAFRAALAPKWLPPITDDKIWFLALLSEQHDRDLPRALKAVIRNEKKEIEAFSRIEVGEEPVLVEVTQVLESPENWFTFLNFICKAPVMIVDASGFQPAVMTLLGIRAVVRRGVTIVTSKDKLDASEFASLPFNIQEIKLLSHSSEYGSRQKEKPLETIGRAIKDGLLHLDYYPEYLDLPAYDAVRCNPPESAEGDIRNTVLVLCSFHENYQENWGFLSWHLKLESAPHPVARMVDITSPRLVGQALYEHIRWSSCCVVDWTHWRPNVFFEFGVRLAASDIGPICLLEEKELTNDSSKNEVYHLKQIQLLNQLFQPFKYELGGSSEPIELAFKAYKEFISKRQRNPRKTSGIDHNDTHRMIVEVFDWEKEKTLFPPHKTLVASAESLFGKDPQKTGENPVIFSNNSEYAPKLRRNIQERWIAAWLYLRNRYTLEELQSNDKLKKELVNIGEAVFQLLSQSQNEDHQRIRKDITDLIYKMEV